MPSGRFYSQIAFVSGKLFLWGGVIDPDTRFYTDVYVLNSTTSSPSSPSFVEISTPFYSFVEDFGWRRYRNDKPVPYRAAFCMNVSGLELIIFGGFDAECNECSDVWIMNSRTYNTQLSLFLLILRYPTHHRITRVAKCSYEGRQTRVCVRVVLW